MPTRTCGLRWSRGFQPRPHARAAYLTTVRRRRLASILFGNWCSGLAPHAPPTSRSCTEGGPLSPESLAARPARGRRRRLPTPRFRMHGAGVQPFGREPANRVGLRSFGVTPSSDSAAMVARPAAAVSPRDGRPCISGRRSPRRELRRRRDRRHVRRLRRADSATAPPNNSLMPTRTCGLRSSRGFQPRPHVRAA